MSIIVWFVVGAVVNAFIVGIAVGMWWRKWEFREMQNTLQIKLNADAMLNQ